ncbi:MAG TPA: HAMP domain-containing sensor histidine kinase [Longimicrobium sp.]|nr:HAMP domain-containing sensor histidine kinase [Longimicrobium sp.]
MANPGRAGGPRSAPIIALLLFTLGLTVLMAYEAQTAALQHRAVAEGALRDYARFSAFLYRGAARQSLFYSIGGLLYPFESVRPAAGTPLPSVGEVLARRGPEPCAVCPRLDSVRGYYRVDLRSGEVETSGTPLPPAVSRWLADSARALAKDVPRVRPSLEVSLLLTRLGGTERAFAYLVRRDSAAAPVAAYGVEVNPRVLAKAAFTHVYANQSVLPPSLTGGQPTDSVMSLTVRDPSGVELFASKPRYRGITGSDTLAAHLGGFTLHVALRESQATRLLTGGMPRPRLPLILALLVLAVGLTGVALVQLRRERELARVRADFVSSVSHELRTPLAQIRMFAETLRLGRVRSEGERQRSIEIIDQEARRLSGLVDNVLLFSRAERRAVRLERSTADLGALVRDAVETFAPLAAARQTTIREALDEGITASVDRGAFRQVLLNLLDNAVKYGPAGQVIEVGLSAEGGMARVWVQDQGPGIPPRERGRVFAPFVRLKRDAESAVAGSGIGLSVVAQLAALHGGRVRVEDVPGGGARFVVELPAEQGSAPAAAPAARGAA